MNPATVEALRLVKRLGLVPSYRNLHIIGLAISSESEFSGLGVAEAAERISEQARYALMDGETVNYFWFEDTGWRYPKLTFKQRDRLDLQREARIGTR